MNLMRVYHSITTYGEVLGGGEAGRQMENLRLVREFYKAGQELKRFYLHQKLSGDGDAKGLLAFIVSLPPSPDTMRASVRVYVCIHVRLCVSVSANLCVGACRCACVHVHLCVCVCVYAA